MILGCFTCMYTVVVIMIYLVDNLIWCELTEWCASQTVCKRIWTRVWPSNHSFIRSVVRSFVRSFVVRLLAQKVTNARMFNALRNVYFTFSLIVSVHLRPFYDKHLILISIFGWGPTYYLYESRHRDSQVRVYRVAKLRFERHFAQHWTFDENSTPLQQMANGIHITYIWVSRLSSKISLNTFWNKFY